MLLLIRLQTFGMHKFIHEIIFLAIGNKQPQKTSHLWYNNTNQQEYLPLEDKQV